MKSEWEHLEEELEYIEYELSVLEKRKYEIYDELAKLTTQQDTEDRLKEIGR